MECKSGHNGDAPDESTRHLIKSLEVASLFRLRNIFSQPHAILNLIFFVRAKKKTFVFFLTAISGLVKDCFVCKTLHFAFCLDFLNAHFAKKAPVLEFLFFLILVLPCLFLCLPLFAFR